MDNSVYIALSKNAAVERQLDVIANNIANANTTGYKTEAVVFSEFLQKDRDNQNSYANDLGTVRDTRQGPLQSTNNQLDFAIQGEGYFGVRGPDGERYTRAGNFAINEKGELVTSEGYQVLDQAGQAITFEPEDTKVTVYADGRMEVDGEERSTLGVFNFEDKAALKKETGSLYTSEETAVVVPEPRIAQGMLENSNVQPIVEMTKLIAVQRDFDRTGKFINNIYEMQENAIRTFSQQ